MKNIKNLCSFFSVICIAGLLFSCEKNSGQEEEQGQKVTLKSKYTSWNGTDVTDFTQGNRIGVYCSANSKTSIKGERLFNNDIFSKNGDGFEAQKTIVLPADGVLLVAYYPYIQQKLDDDKEQLQYSLKTDQSGTEDYLSSQFVTASGHISSQSYNADLNFKNLFSKINIILASNLIDKNILKNSFVELMLRHEALVNLSSLSAQVSGTQAKMIPYGTLKIEGEKVIGKCLVVPPQKIARGEEFVTAIIDGKNTKFSFDKEWDFKSGMEYDFELQVTKIGEDYSVDIDVSEKEWVVGDDFSAVVEEDGEELLPVKDIDGNEYDIIRIGTQIWFASDLKTTKFNDGTAITLYAENNAWISNDTEPGYAYYNADPGLGVLYNWPAVGTEKLCPEGWHIPTRSEYEVLINYLGGGAIAGESLKSQSKWLDYNGDEKPAYQGSNKSGFNGYPNGYREPTSGDFVNNGKFGYWWSSTQSGDNKLAYAIYLYYNNPEVIEMDVIKRTGYAVRCMKY